MSTSMTHTTTEHIGDTTDNRSLLTRVQDAWGDARWHAGHALQRLGHRVAWGMPENPYAVDEEFDAGYRVGYRAGRREHGGGAMFRVCRTAAGLSVEAVAERSEVSEGTIEAWEQEARGVDAATYHHLSNTVADYIAGRWTA